MYTILSFWGLVSVNGLKEKGKLITKEKIAIDSCGGTAAYTMMQKEFIKTVVASMTNPEQSQVADSKPKVPASDDGIYRTTAKALAELYSANEVAADDKLMVVTLKSPELFRI